MEFKNDPVYPNSNSKIDFMNNFKDNSILGIKYLLMKIKLTKTAI